MTYYSLVFPLFFAAAVLAFWLVPPKAREAVLLAAGLIAALWGYARRQRRVEALCLLVMLAYAFMECQSFHLTTNPAALLLAGAGVAQAPRPWGGGYGPSET